jgi:hypothetical protein
MTWEAEAVYRNDKGEVRILLVYLDGKYYLKFEHEGVVNLIPFTSTINDVDLGLLKLVDDPRRAQPIETINDLVVAFPKSDFDAFLEREPEFRAAFANDFENVPNSRVIYFSKRISEHADQMVIERLKAETREETHE